jgi:hypothetical protein
MLGPVLHEVPVRVRVALPVDHDRNSHAPQGKVPPVIGLPQDKEACDMCVTAWPRAL